MTVQKKAVTGLFLVALVLNIGFWTQTRAIRGFWANVPPVPSAGGARSMTLGDDQFSYRTIGLTLQNMGDSGGRTVALKDYNFERLGQWFMLEDKLDERSNYIPMLAAFYFGGVQKGKFVGPVVDYLEVAGKHPYDEKWRWLAQAVYLARHIDGDMNRALVLANELAAEYRPGRPAWMLQMPALILTEKGDRKAAYAMMLSILKDSVSDKMDPAEIYFTRDYICSNLLEPDEVKTNPLCKGLKDDHAH